MPNEAPHNASDDQIERLSEDLKRQVERAKARLSEQYVQLMEDRSFELPEKREA